jgi:hypothetical protein
MSDEGLDLSSLDPGGPTQHLAGLITRKIAIGRKLSVAHQKGSAPRVYTSGAWQRVRHAYIITCGAPLKNVRHGHCGADGTACPKLSWSTSM